MNRKIMLAVVSMLAVTPAHAGNVAALCFTPDQDCTRLAVEVIDKAKSSLEVQAYSFTSRPIGTAIAIAARRGVKVKVIVDRSQLEERGNEVSWLVGQGIPVLVDSPPGGIAHNKVIVVDRSRVITGSFNFTTAAQHNAENLIVIDGTDIAAQYEKNFDNRAALSRPLR